MLQTGLNIANDVDELKKPFKQAFQERVRQSDSNFQQKAKDNLDKFMRRERGGYKAVGLSGLPPHLASVFARKKRKNGVKKRAKRVVKKKMRRKVVKKRKEIGKKRKRRSSKKTAKKKKKSDFIDIFN